MRWSVEFSADILNEGVLGKTPVEFVVVELSETAGLGAGVAVSTTLDVAEVALLSVTLLDVEFRL
jgi:hypothetical protein